MRLESSKKENESILATRFILCSRASAGFWNAIVFSSRLKVVLAAMYMRR
jgi:hypothetical protein